MSLGGISPWANRASIISTWPVIVSGWGQGTHANLLDRFFKDNMGTQAWPIPISRACRLTRFALRVTHDTGVSIAATLEIHKANGCAADSYTTVASEDFVIQDSDEGPTCVCGRFDPSIEWDECDLWRPNIVFVPSITLPRARVSLEWELR